VNATWQVKQVVGILIGVVCTFVPAMIQWQEPGAVSSTTLLGVALLGGAIGGRVLVPAGERMRAHLSAMLCGAIAAAGAFGLLLWWISGRQSVHSGEFLIVTLVGALPGTIAGQWLHERVRIPDEQIPTAKARQA
jgi:hypothetical protein